MMMNNSTVTVDYTDLVKSALNDKGSISKCYTLFRDYSLLNTYYVARQQLKRFGEVNPIKGFRAWNDLNRKVKKGEKALEVLFPVFGSFPKRDENGEEMKDASGKKIMIKYVKGFVPKHIHFAYNQTEIMDKAKADKIKEMNKPIEFDLCKVVNALGIELIKYDMLDGNCQGYARPDKKQLAINPVAEDPTKTAVHEIAHILLEHHKGDLDRATKEVQAELVTYMVMSMLGASDLSLEHSRGYIQHWLQDNELTQDVSKKAMNIASRILEICKGK